MNEHACCKQENEPPKPWYARSFFWILLATAFLLTLSYFLPAFQPFRRAFLDYSRMVAWPVAMGFLIGGMVDYYVPREYISRYLASKHKRTVFYAAGLGFLMSACSHGILALSMELHKKGASGPAVICFLLASPWANLPITFLLIGFFGLKAFLIIFTALLIAILTGLFFQVLDHKGMIEKNRHTVPPEKDFSLWLDLRQRFSHYRFNFKKEISGISKGAFELFEMVAGWLLVGMILAALSSAFVPPEIFRRFLGPTFPGLLWTMLLATVLEVCSEGTAPFAFEIYRQSHAFGNAFAFLMGGVVTDYTEIGLVWANLGRKTAVWMVLVTLPQVVFWGWIFNRFF